MKIKLMALVLFSLCSSSISAANVTARAGVITVAGVVDDATVLSVNSLITKNTRTIRIASPGGDTGAMLDLANIVLNRNLTVAVTGICAASCAAYVFVAGRRRIVEQDAIVMFQKSATADLEMYGAVGDKVPTGWKYEALLQSAREIGLLNARGVNARIYHDFLWATQPICLGFSGGLGVESRWHLESAYVAWVPTKDYLQSRSLLFSGYWPNSQADVQKLLVKWMGPQARLVKYGENDHLMSERMGTASAFGICPPIAK